MSTTRRSLRHRIRWLAKLQAPESKLPKQVLWFARCCYLFLSSSAAVNTDVKKRARFVRVGSLATTLIFIFYFLFFFAARSFTNVDSPAAQYKQSMPATESNSDDALAVTVIVTVSVSGNRQYSRTLTQPTTGGFLRSFQTYCE
jgi:hypothetical protein